MTDGLVSHCQLLVTNASGLDFHMPGWAYLSLKRMTPPSHGNIPSSQMLQLQNSMEASTNITHSSAQVSTAKDPELVIV